MDERLKQRLVGAMVLIALAIIFLPMLLSRKDDFQYLDINPPAVPSFTGQAPLPLTPESVVARAPSESVTSERLDKQNLPVSWSIQLASLSKKSSAESLRDRLRQAGHNAYVRPYNGMFRVLVGPLAERPDADRLNAQLSRNYGVQSIVVRFEP